jgi:predicted RNA-binding protein with PUA-like domain
MKSEPAECSIDDALAAPQATVPWIGVRNYQARNFMRDAMRVGDGVLFYHSSCALPGIAGMARVASLPRPDPTQFDPASLLRPRSSAEKPRWVLVDVQALRRRAPSAWPSCAHPSLAGMGVLQKGSRLSITPVSPQEWETIVALADHG